MITLLLIVVTVLISWQAFERPRLRDRLILWPPAIDRKRQYERLLTHGFIHNDWMHLLFNMITLFFFGATVERYIGQAMGPLGFVFFYVSAVIVAILPTYLRHRHDPHYASLGASGAVSAVVFAFVLLNPWALIFIPVPVPAVLYAIGYVAYSFWKDHQGDGNINHNAHLSGAIYGVLFMFAMDRGIWAHFTQALLSPLS